eukprot:COSAG06_NODE_4937_length_3848_cov_2.634302_3_plen_70_part_00
MKMMTLPRQARDECKKIKLNKKARLFHTQLDKTEHHDVAETNPTVVKELMTMFEALDSEYHPPIENPEE